MKIGDILKNDAVNIEIKSMKQTGKTVQINGESIFVITDEKPEEAEYIPAIIDRMHSLEVSTNLSGKELEKALKKLEKLLGK